MNKQMWVHCHECGWDSEIRESVKELAKLIDEEGGNLVEYADGQDICPNCQTYDSLEVMSD